MTTPSRLAGAILAASLGASIGAAPALASDFPTDEITILVPFAPGGGVDTTNRIIADAANNLGLVGDQRLVVTNNSNTVVAQASVAQAPPDGYTVLGMTSSIVTNPKLQSVPFSVADFRPVALYSIEYTVVAVPTDSPLQTMEDFITAATEGEVTMVTSGIGTSHNMSGLSLQARGGLNLNIINIAAFGEQVQQIAGGHVQAALWPFGAARAQVEAGTARILGSASRERLPGFEDVPTWAEAGLDIAEFTTFRGWGVPRDTPDEVVEFLAGILETLSENEDYVERMEQGGSPVAFAGPEGFAEIIAIYDVLTDEILN